MGTPVFEEPDLHNWSSHERRVTAEKVMRAYKSWTVSSFLEFCDEDCVHEFRPASLNIPPLTNVEYVAYITPILPLFHKFHMHVHEIIEDVNANELVISASGSAQTAAGPYNNEYMFVLSFNENGDKATKIVTFVDSHVALSITEKIKALNNGSLNLTHTSNTALIV